MSGDTIVALSTGRLPSAIAIVRASGPKAAMLAERLTGRAPAAREAGFHIFRDPSSGDAIDEGICLFFPGPNSVTGEDVVEFQGHGSVATVESLIDVMTSYDDVRLAKAGEFTRRALFNGKMSLSEAEGLADLIEAETQEQRRSALTLLRGGLQSHWEELRDGLVELSAMAEGAIDYVGDEDETGGHDGRMEEQRVSLLSRLDEMLTLPDRRPIRDGIRVVLAGPTNAGKSSLINAIAGSDRAIVSDIAGTTRDIIEVPLRIDGTAYIFVDTAGLRDSEDQIEQIGIQRTNAALEQADILLWLGDSGACPEHPRTVLIAPKLDLRDQPVDEAINLSSTSGEGLSNLFAELSKLSETLLPDASGLSLTNWHRATLMEIRELITATVGSDPVIFAENLRFSRHLVDRLVGQAGVDHVLDRLFGRFCLGK
ncbi:tRNA uridine-5-carboxymethylaminomethyl(34) synthesis GTPase MnmE [Sphingomicrobium flavum]|uniref:tRNA uridine-5-carboxymethylaminomethyl(34) synthesis GTPase MnmE n=1 Tax=Sphingomicrobium flavum TaxID=1229164 RepID=UPI0021ADDB50|nr:tRNA uridine-5-carboxymethylaminomethyl(34) synthesis GTPase MnmE [Sphingomicrobium flavum]